ncbi:alpha/beta-hydrolase [Punctularia strigosozonata HHB-11173 SS5]|uniref:alpha/beta-hydrolase n=1 Tax=Punctularia strigosozonata (strain HHB-11173) TaxID=741275 RepID=UPI0004416F20|nr:alpha/beta-hydrolase [Punctularia strigosozonata HHB-11173 SS5]EIN13422.1 alpha/beta-hydrolase [Punctularia strigosozonata HHB-11173 SS5]
MSSTAKTLTYSHVDGIDVKLDLYAPDATGSAPVFIWFHGGGLFCGSRDDDLFPASLLGSMGPERIAPLDAAHKRNWIFISADYRLLVPSTGHDELADIRALSSFLNSDAFRAALPSGLVPSGVTFVSGGSAGGYMALQYALHASPKPKAVLNLFGMTDLLSDHYVRPHPEGLRFFGGFHPSFPKLDQLLRSPVSAYSPVRVPSFDTPDGRNVLMLHALQDGIVPDYLMTRPGLSAKLGALSTPEERAAALDEGDRPLFPFLRAAELPPVVSVHGVADTAVPFADSEHLKQLLDAAGIKNELFPIATGEHGLLDKDNLGALAPGAEEAQARALEFLASTL